MRASALVLPSFEPLSHISSEHTSIKLAPYVNLGSINFNFHVDRGSHKTIADKVVSQLFLMGN